MTIEEKIARSERFAKLCGQAEIPEWQVECEQIVAWLRELMERRKQQKIVQCKDCKWWKKQKDSAQGRCRLLGIYPTGAWYCANGAIERRTDDNTD